MSSRSIKRLVAAGLVAGGLAAGGPALASMGSSSGGAPGQQAPVPGASRSTPGTGVTTCSGGTQHRAVVKGSDAPLSWSGGAQLVTQQITTSAAQGFETLVVTFSGETYADATLAWIQADIEVDGVTVDPSDDGSPNAFKSGASYVDASLTRCVRVPVGVHQVRARLTTVGTGFAWVDDYTLHIDQLD
jgi:hypothetical protein